MVLDTPYLVVNAWHLIIDTLQLAIDGLHTVINIMSGLQSSGLLQLPWELRLV
jgi:hypothetical protein